MIRNLRWLFVALLFISGQGLAQTQAADNSIISGHFEVPVRNEARNLTEHVNVNYVISPAQVSNSLNIELGTPEPVTFRVEVLNANGKKVASWKGGEASHIQNASIDVRKLPSGRYSAEIYWNKSDGLLQKLYFSKTQQ